MKSYQQQHDTSPTNKYVRVVPPFPNLLGRPAVGIGTQPIHNVDPAHVLADLSIGIHLHDHFFETLIILWHKYE